MPGTLLTTSAASNPAALGWGAEPDDLTDAERAAADDARRAGLTDGTVADYGALVERFAAWCGERGRASYPAHPAHVAAYVRHLTDDRGLRVSTVRKHLAAISTTHRRGGFPSPCADERVRSAIRRAAEVHGTRKHQRGALTPTHFLLLLTTEPPRGRRSERAHALQIARDRALLALGYAGGFRSAELVGVDVAHLSWQPGGVSVFLPRSKTDRTGEGRHTFVDAWPGSEVCPVALLRRWLALAEVSEGAVFRHVSTGGELGERLNRKAVWRLVKRAGERAGFDPGPLGSHSLRASHATNRIAAGEGHESVADTLGHARTDTTRQYDRRRNGANPRRAAALRGRR